MHPKTWTSEKWKIYLLNTLSLAAVQPHVIGVQETTHTYGEQLRKQFAFFEVEHVT